VGYRADELAVLDYRATAHECVQVGTTHFYKLLIALKPFAKKIIIFCSFQVCFVIQTNPLYIFLAFIHKSNPWTIPYGMLEN